MNDFAGSLPGGPRGVAVAMFGHTGLGMLICRSEYFIRAQIYALTGIFTHALSALPTIAVQPFPSSW